MLEEVLGQPVVFDKGIDGCHPDAQPKAPGMKYRHYAPKAEMVIVDGELEKVVAYINKETERLSSEGKKVAVMATDEAVVHYKATVVKSMGSRKNPGSLAYDFYTSLREFDDEEVDCIFSEGLGEEGVEHAVMNRMIRAAGHKKIQL